MDLRKLKKLIDLVQESGIAELEITEGEEKVKIVKGGVVTTSMMAAPPAAVAAPAAAAETSPSPRRMATWSRRRWSVPSTARPRPTPRPSSRSGRQ
jgi:acetyl-CoA carboxylase biotin carboxyl carrier protein